VIEDCKQIEAIAEVLDTIARQDVLLARRILRDLPEPEDQPDLPLSRFDGPATIPVQLVEDGPALLAEDRLALRGDRVEEMLEAVPELEGPGPVAAAVEPIKNLVIEVRDTPPGLKTGGFLG
jgi:hypothetical protein